MRVRSGNSGNDVPVTGEFSREHWIVPVHGFNGADRDGIAQATARRDGTVSLRLSCGNWQTTVSLDVCRAAQLCTGIWEAAGAAQRLTGYLGDDQPPPPQPPHGPTDLPQAWRSHPNRPAALPRSAPMPRRRPIPMNNDVARDATRTIGLRVRQFRKARDKSLRVIAGLAGMSSSTLHRIEHGQRELTLSEIVALGNALEIHPAKLIGLSILAPTTDHMT